MVVSRTICGLCRMHNIMVKIQLKPQTFNMNSPQEWWEKIIRKYVITPFGQWWYVKSYRTFLLCLRNGASSDPSHQGKFKYITTTHREYIHNMHLTTHLKTQHTKIHKPWLYCPVLFICIVRRIAHTFANISESWPKTLSYNYTILPTDAANTWQ